MNVKQLKELIANLPDDMTVVFRSHNSEARPIAGIHIRPYNSRWRCIFGPTEAHSYENALVINPYDASPETS